MFSPWYALARRRRPTDPLQHSAAHVVLFGPRARWAMTERGRTAVTRDAANLTIGPSQMNWDGSTLLVDLREWGFPLPRRLLGTIRVTPAALTNVSFPLDGEARHVWSPLAPRARIEVALSEPALTWSGDGYLDHNVGARPMEADFVRWDWSRAALGKDAILHYDVTRRDGTRHLIAQRMAADGTTSELPQTPVLRLPDTRWRVRRETRATEARVTRTLLDAPFYARSVLATRIDNIAATAMHESLSLDRFRALWVQAMLPFRVPRRA